MATERKWGWGAVGSDGVGDTFHDMPFRNNPAIFLVQRVLGRLDYFQFIPGNWGISEMDFG